MNDDLKTDPIDATSSGTSLHLTTIGTGQTPKFRAVIKSVTKEAEENLKKEGYDSKMTGFCHLLWPEIKRILKEKHNIDWKSPKDTDTFTLFD